MNKSEDISELAAALSNLQGEIKDAIKDTAAHKYKYADLSQVLEISRPLLAKNGLSVAQLPGSAHDRVTVETILMHKSGQWISSTIEMAAIQTNSMNAAQAIGAVITYARRYALAAMMGITQTDTDATDKDTLEVKVDGNSQRGLIKLTNNQTNEIRELIKVTETHQESLFNGLRGRGIVPIGELKIENFPQSCFDKIREMLMTKKENMEKIVGKTVVEGESQHERC